LAAWRQGVGVFTTEDTEFFNLYWNADKRRFSQRETNVW